MDRSHSQDSRNQSQNKVVGEIHVVTYIDVRNRDCFTDCALTISKATSLGERAVKNKRAKSFRIDSFKPKIVGYGILWVEFERIKYFG